jgi:hypothetical protein
MKHVFFVHSHITNLVSRAIVRHRGIQAQEVLFVRSRGYEPPSRDYAQVDFPVMDERLVPTRHLGRWLHERRSLARFVDQVGTEDFVWYLPHTAFLFFKTFISHPRCLGFNLIEEGMGSYHPPGVLDGLRQAQARARPVNWRARFVRWVGLEPRLVFADPRYMAAYGCTEDAFPGFPRKVRVSIDEPAARAPVEAIETVVVFDAVLEQALAGPEAFFQCVDELVQLLAGQQRGRVFFKLHPQQYVDTRHVGHLRQSLAGNVHGLHFIELPADFCLEQLAQSGRTDFFVFTSSVGIYAAQAGCRVFSMARRVAELDARYRLVLEGVPAAIRSKMQFL